MVQLNEKVKEKNQLNYEKIASSPEFTQLITKKKMFIIPYTLFFICYSLLLPFLSFYTNILNHNIIGDITWGWLYGVSIIAMSLFVCSIYVIKSQQFDEDIQKIIEKEGL
ncbi:DUF485 domain-containing protein [Bacillus testis]|uniref:DUF485 domain-containing protein n=1 Tax=Bacillus testis TaxID=1622072 RepID=UPI00067E9F0B|nr:DUF485 domain-containing protein [Bacillus testis]